MRRILRFAIGILLPSALILVGLLVLTGCFYIPTFNAPVGGTNVAPKVGDANSKRPIRVGLATREQIVRMFGEPPYIDDTGRRIGYIWTVKNGVWIVPLCFTSETRLGQRGIELDFDDGLILRKFVIVVQDDRWALEVQQTMPGTVSPLFDPALHWNPQAPPPRFDP